MAIKEEPAKSKEELNATMQNLSSKLDTISDRQRAIDESVDLIKNRLGTVEATLSDMENVSSSNKTNEVLSEVLDNQLRAKNIIFYGIPESNATTAELRIADDRTKIAEIFSTAEMSLDD